jgi:integrase
LDKPLPDINTWVVSKWRTEQLRSGKLKSTVNRDIATLKAAVSKALEWGVVGIHPLEKLKPLKVNNKKKVRFLLEEEEHRLRLALSARDERIKTNRKSGNEWRRARGYTLFPDISNQTYADHLTPMVLLSLNTGLRRGEAFNLTWGNISFHTRTITVEGEIAKSEQTRHIPLNDEALAVLKAWLEQSDTEGLVFPGKDGKRLDNVRKSWAGVLKDAAITNFRWHDLRHDFASKLVMAGVPLNTVRELLGHVDLTTTLRYAHLAPDHKLEAVAMLNR